MQSIKKVRFEIEINEDMVLLEFKENDESQNSFITKEGINIQAKIQNDTHCYEAKRVDNKDFLKEYTGKLVDLFINNYNQNTKQMIDDLEDGVETTSEDENTEANIIVPYDPNSIRVTQARFSLREIYEMIVGSEFDEPILDLSPDFQRNYVWDSTRKSRLIESILLKIPLPVFYLARDNEGKYQVVDGVQRLSVIKEYFSNSFKLRNLEYLKEDCDNKYFQKSPSTSLHPKFVRQLKAYQIDCNIIEPDTPHKVKLDIFKRLNTGGKSLNAQEIRNSILRKNSRDFIRQLSKSEEFKKATSNSISPKRMMDQELILRYIGFYLIYKKQDLFTDLNYNSLMDEFLDNVVEVLNSEYKKFPFETIKKDFHIAMENAYIMFGDYAFRKVDVDFSDEAKNKINKSLFTAFSVLISRYDTSVIKERGNITKEFAERLDRDKYLYNSITYATSDKTRVDTTFLRIDEFLESIYGGKYD
ncbi:DUF262 domain-containing protein [Herbivorax sp. ANBcel31]|uniref:DUF262 domain-containing protein n=1 Tax=Herbivorax sp. ANBcel31 TaxID=3069754 RepID=UPI0027B325BD|nr:DUF262 domain-containing protein [Herbivorax sp. ANBcel31]MDQ2087759.1 DUF262 domain-containing protein [Herbivorax sp. ANBcel31]